MTQATTADTRSERRRREVCEAALRVIVKNGLEVTTLRDISREGGFTTGVVSHYFPDKQSVIRGAFMLASEEWLAEARERLAHAESAEQQLQELVRLAVPEDGRRRAEWRLWAEMWTYAGRMPEFVATLIETDARWEHEIHGVLARARAAGMLGDIDIDVEATALARMIDGIGLRAWLSGRWAEGRRHLVLHLAAMGVPGDLVERMLHDRRPA
ncbi:MAG: TetR/AcrR family transcriptional regulator [Gaiellales bacterium]